MKKLSLELDALKVESFGTTAPQPGRGTVVGAESALVPNPGDGGGGNSDEGSCQSCVTCNRPTDPCLCDDFTIG